jgi:guanylate kinase
VGKGTVVHALLARRPDLFFSVSVTTRAPRPGEVDGVHYRFVSDDRFDAMVAAGGLLEWAQLYGGHRSGTPAAAVEAALASGRDVLLEVDVQGAASVRERVPEAILIFLQPPSEAELARRLRSRGTESEADLERRLAEARREMGEAGRFDHIVVNDQVERAVDEVLAIIEPKGEPG